MKAPVIVVSLLASAWFVAACGAQDPAVEQPTPAAEPAAEAVAPEQAAAAAAPAEPAQPVEATPAEPVAPADPVALTVAVEGMTKGQSGPGKQPLAVTAAAETNAIVVSLANYSHYCAPAPSFTATVKAESLEIAAVKPTGSISRCFAPHAMKLRVELPGRNAIRSVVLLGADGKQLATAVIGAK